MVSDKKLANTLGGKTARACDNCVRKRARWYCAADDAFLCQSCDSSVHSANPLARRHERVRLKTSSLKILKSLNKTSSDVSVASWHSGFTRKTRSTRIKKQGKFNFGEEKRNFPLHVVPDDVSDDSYQEENEEEVVFRVPIFDSSIEDLCNSSKSNELRNTINYVSMNEQMNNMLYENQFHGSIPSEKELAEFAADVEPFDMEGLGLMDMDCSFGREQVKVEEVEIANDQENDGLVQITTGPFEFKFDDCSPRVYEEENKIQTHQSTNLRKSEEGEESDEKKKGRILLNLDYGGVMNAWDDKRCPWTNELQCQLSVVLSRGGTCGRVHNHGDREARLSSYREKRRTRVFSKKIRYEVRKLNAEKRPRMKGRFVKKTSFTASGCPLLNK
ncbi:hypothetical protein Leryth_024886 [Lithospermum erythrorhizon]|nr:hypothetical protein Leryth_024886 [Lithospermum erythrorhizon]